MISWAKLLRKAAAGRLGVFFIAKKNPRKSREIWQTVTAVLSGRAILLTNFCKAVKERKDKMHKHYLASLQQSSRLHPTEQILPQISDDIRTDISCSPNELKPMPRSRPPLYEMPSHAGRMARLTQQPPSLPRDLETALWWKRLEKEPYLHRKLSLG